MKKIKRLIIGLLLCPIFALPAGAGTLTTNKFLYKPNLGARGDTEKKIFDAGLDRIDARLGKEIWVGDPNYGTTFQDAITAIGSTTTILRVPAGTYDITTDTTLPANITLKPERGTTFAIATTKTLTINGSLDAGPYQIFSCTGTGKVVLAPGAVKETLPQWFGAVDGTTDSSAAILAATNATPTGGIVRFTTGLWSIKSPLVITKTVSLRGSFGAYLWLNVGTGNDGITIGSVDTDRFNFEIDHLTVLGPANACNNAVVLIRNHGASIKGLNITCGTVGYGAVIQGCNNGTYDIVIAYFYAPSGYGLPDTVRASNGIILSQNPSPNDYQSNLTTLKCTIDGTTGVGLNIQGSDEVADISGLLENMPTGYAIKAYRAYNFRFHDMYVDEVNLSTHDSPFYFEECQNLKFDNIYGAQTDFQFVNCQSVSMDTGQWGDIHIDSLCTGFRFGNVNLHGNSSRGIAARIYDNGQGTVYGGAVTVANLVPIPLANGKSGLGDQQNLLDNTNFERWQSDRPDSWNLDWHNTPMVQCGDGLADTTRHGTRYCLKSTNNVGSYINPSLNIDADAIKQMLGHTVTFSAWVYHASGQNPGTWPYFNLQYVQGGNTIGNATKFTTPLSAATDDAWTKVYVGCFIPADATNVMVNFMQYATTTDVLYISEPCLWVDGGAATSFVRGRNEVGSFIMVDGHKITFGTAPPTTGWWKQGDVRFNVASAVGQPNGWRCTDSGTPGTWESMGNL